MKHALSTIRYFDIHGAQYHDTILNQCIDILPYRYVLQIPIPVATYILGAFCTGNCVAQDFKYSI